MHASDDDQIVMDVAGRYWRWRPSLGGCCAECGRPPGVGHVDQCSHSGVKLRQPPIASWGPDSDT